MKKSLLAMAALMGVATLPAHAWRVNIDKESYADIYFGAQVMGTYQGKRTSGTGTSSDHSATNFSAKLVSIGANGQVNNLVYFGILAESTSPGLRESFVVRDAFIGLKFADEFKVQAGAMRIPFSRATLTSSYNLLIPTQDMFNDVYGRGLYIDPIDGLSVRANAKEKNRDAGIVVWGNVADGMLKYYLGVTDGKYDNRTSPFGKNAKDNLAYTIRLQFTPTMLGFKGETEYTLADTYLGKQNVLTFGVAYRAVKAETTGLTPNYSKTAKLWTADMLYEQKFGDIVPNLQVGYIQAKDVTFDYNSSNCTGICYGKATQIYAQAQLLYDQVVGFGKPALAIRWEQDKNKDLTDTAYQGVKSLEPKNTRLGIFANYYIKGQDAKISFGVDNVNRNSDSKKVDGNGKNFTDFTLYLQTRF